MPNKFSAGPSSFAPFPNRTNALPGEGSVISRQPANKPDDEFSSLTDDMKNLRIRIAPQNLVPASSEIPYFGASSLAILVIKTMELRDFYSPFPMPSRQDNHWERYHSRSRPEMWQTPTWEKYVGEIAPLTVNLLFPPADLVLELLDHYFREVNTFFPLLHRPTFEHCLRNNLHLRDVKFASTYLAVAAIGSRWCENGRVFAQGKGLRQAEYTQGWVWYNQVANQRNGFSNLPNLYDLQFHAVCVQRLFASSNRLMWNSSPA